MALDARIHYRTFARIDRTPDISSRYWSKLFDTYRVGLNFDGELFGLGDRFEALIDAGFRWKNEDSSEICLNTTKGRAGWLQRIRVVPDDLTIEPFEAWTIAGSRCEFVQCQWSNLFFMRDINSHWEFPDQVTDADKQASQK